MQLRPPNRFRKATTTSGDTAILKDILKTMALAAEPIADVITPIYFDANKLVLSGSTIYIEANFNHGIISKVAVSFNKLLELISQIDKGNISFELADNKIKITTDDKKFKASLAIINEPLIEIAKSNNWLSLPEDFISGLECCSISVAKDKTTSWILDHYGISNNAITTTDNLRCTRYLLSSSLNGSFSLPIKMQKLLLKVKPLEYSITSGSIEFRDDTYYVKHALIGSDYPAYVDVFNASVLVKCKLEDFLSLTKKVKVFYKIGTNDLPYITLTFSANKITIFSSNDFGESEGEISANCSDDVTVHANPDHLVEALSIMNKALPLLNMEVGLDRIVLLQGNLSHALATLV